MVMLGCTEKDKIEIHLRNWGKIRPNYGTTGLLKKNRQMQNLQITKDHQAIWRKVRNKYMIHPLLYLMIPFVSFLSSQVRMRRGNTEAS